MARKTPGEVALGGREEVMAPHSRWLGSPFQPDSLQRKTVELMVAHGVPYREIASVIANPATGKPICTTTLMKRFRKELNEGRRRADSEVAASLYRQAVGRAKVIVDGEVVEEERLPVTSAAIWWSKARMGWKAGGETDEGDARDRASEEPVGQVVVYLPDNGREPGSEGAPAPAS